MSAVGVSAITSPELSSVRCENIAKINLAFELYLWQISEVNLNLNIAQRITPVWTKDYVSLELPIYLTQINIFEGRKVVS